MCASVGEGINTDAGNEQEALFSLAALRGKGPLADLAEVSAPAEHEMEEFEADSDTNAAQPGEQDSDDVDDTDEEERYGSRRHILSEWLHALAWRHRSCGSND